MLVKQAEMQPVRQAAIQQDTGAAKQGVLQQESFATPLALIAGYIDAYGYINYKTYSSFMSGNTTQTGLHAGQGNLQEMWHSFFPIAAFVVGVFVGVLMLHSQLRQPLRWVLALVAFLLVAGLADARLGLFPEWVGVVLLCVAMGAMNTSISKVGSQSVGLGYVSGTLNNLAQQIALAVKHQPVANPRNDKDTNGQRILILFGIWASFAIGALLGGAATPKFAAWTLLLPILVLVILTVIKRASLNKA